MKRKGKFYLKYESRYTLAPSQRSKNNLYWLCAYCGQPAETRDHVPPISRVDDYMAYNLKVEIYIKVPCCKQCNSWLSDSLQESFQRRFIYAKEIMERKWKSKLKPIDWSENEILELGKNLRSKIVSEINKSSKFIERHEYYEGADIVCDWINENYF